MRRILSPANSKNKMKHLHVHSHNHDVPHSANGRFIFCAALNTLYVICEAVAGLRYGSMALLSDAGHNLSDVFSLLLVLLSFWLVGLKGNSRFSYGYKKSSVLISLVNAVILLVAVGAIIIESFHRLQSVQQVPGQMMSWIAGLGIVVNGLTAWLLMKDKEKDLNIKGAFLHMLADTLVSLGVVFSGLAISIWGCTWLDPSVSIVIAVVILFSTFKLLKESLCMVLDGVPESEDKQKIIDHISGLAEIEGWHHLHIWPVSATENAATLHVVLKDISGMSDIKKDLKRCFAEHGVSHCTIEIETTDETCDDLSCCTTDKKDIK